MQKENVFIAAYYDQFNELIYMCTRYNVIRTSLEFNITFILGLKEWKNICLMIKTQENFDTYSLSNLYNILKAHMYEVKEIVEETKKMNFGGPLALFSKTSNIEVCSDGEADDREEGMLMTYDEEVVPYYSNNTVKKFYKNPVGGNFKKKLI